MPISRLLLAKGYMDPEVVRRCLPTWDEESVLDFIREIQRFTTIEESQPKRRDPT